MSYCDKCQIEVKGNIRFCPLCQNELQIQNKKMENFYPVVEPRSNSHMLLKVFGFIALVISILAVFFNIIFPTGRLWSVLVMGIMGFVWLSLSVAIKKHRHIMKYLWYQIMIFSLLTIFIDYMTGNYGWAMSIVIPCLLTTAMIVMSILPKVLHLQVGDYLIYLLLDALIGIVPFIFMVIGDAITDIPSMICILTSMISVAGMIIFEGKKMMSELKRRLHV
ncbi:MAG: hypothetical protein J6F30_07170 [Cellulosilyticum sp.]|nr:hypothetical protein [Cellulosilyticum sp.]